MFRTLVFWTVAGAVGAVAHGCSDSSPGQSTAPTAAAGAPNPPAAGTSGTLSAPPPTHDASVPVSGAAAGSGGSMAGAAAGMPGQIAGAGAGAGAGAAGSSGASGAGAPPAQGNERMPCDIASVLGRQCYSCHGETLNLGAPMHLTTWSDLHAPAVTDPTKKVHEVVAVRVQDTVRPMPPKMNGKLAVADRTLLVNWSGQGAPALPSSAADCP
jgi:hypothetical protein